jgi:hypothetical protein
MNRLVDYVNLLDDDILNQILVDVDGVKYGKKRNRENRRNLLNHYFGELKKASNIKESVHDRNEILRFSFEILMKKIGIRFTPNLDDQALFLLFQKYIHKKMIDSVTPILHGGYFWACCDDQHDEMDRKLLETFINNLDIDKNQKDEFLRRFLIDVEKDFQSCKKKDKASYIAKKFKSQTKEIKTEILKFCSILSIMSENLTPEKNKFNYKLEQLWGIDHADTVNLKKEATQIYSNIKASEFKSAYLGRHYFDAIIINKLISKVSRATLIKKTGVFILKGLLGFGVYSRYNKMIHNAKYKNLIMLLGAILLKKEEFNKENKTKISAAITLFQKLATDTKEMLELCRNIHFYLENVNKTYADVSDQAWINGVVNQISSTNRDKLINGSIFLKEIATDVEGLLFKTMAHQKSLNLAIEEHLCLIASSDQLHDIVYELLNPNKKSAMFG